MSNEKPQVAGFIQVSVIIFVILVYVFLFLKTLFL
jgi:hypothetical protein